MAPPMLEQSKKDHNYPTMSTTHSEISGVVACACRRHNSNTASNPSPASSMIPRILHFRKYHIPISLPKLQPVSNTAWSNKYGLYQLVLTIYGPLKLHSVSDTTP